jgi:hypothetical protein
MKTRTRRAMAAAIAGFVGFAAGGCTLTDKITGGVVGGTLLLAGTPAQDMEQTHYLGVFDPQDQLPPAIYRVRLRGQASLISSAKIQSGWVPAGIADSLSTNLSAFGESSTAGALPDQLKVGRRLVAFGPDGFREAPANHRFVVVAGSTPEAFFQAASQVLGDVANARDGAATRVLRTEILEALVALGSDRRQAETMKRGLTADMTLEDARRTGGRSP